MDDIDESNYAIIYCRVSTTMQAENGMGIDMQLRECEKWCYRNDMKIKAVFSDEAKTGKKVDDSLIKKSQSLKSLDIDPSNYKLGKDDPDYIDDINLSKIEGISHRTEFKESLKLTKKGDMFICYSLTRLARNLEIALQVYTYLTNKKVFLCAVKDNIDMRNKNSKMQFSMLSIFAELEGDLIRDRVQSSMDLKKERGEFVGAVPYGYKLDGGPGGPIVQDPKEQEVIKLIKELRDIKDIKGKPMNYTYISIELNKRGIKTKNGKDWGYSQISRILNRTGEPARVKGSSIKNKE